MSDESPILKSLTENSTEVPLASGGRDSYALLLVLLCVFAGGTLLLLAILLIFCHRCCPRGRRYSRASDDLEKTNTTYVEEAQPSQDITIRLEGVDGLSAAGCHGDVEAEGYLSAVATGRRVSFNEQAIYEQSKKNQEKGRRYTLTEGDFHHLKRARLTHLHIPPPALNILTIMESETSIQQPLEEGLSWSPQSSSGGLPGDALNSVLDTSFTVSLPSLPEPAHSRTMEVTGERGWIMGGQRADVDPEVTRASSGATGATGQGFTKMFFTKLRRHTSLEGASPYLRMKRWRIDKSQRAASLDMRGSPKRRAFQRQRAASETLDQEEAESRAVGGDLLCSLAPPLLPDPASRPRRLSAGSLPPPAPGRLEVEVVIELSSGAELVVTPDLPVTLAVMSHPVGEENGLDMGQEDEELEDEEEEEEEEEEGAVGGSGGGTGGVGGGAGGWGGPGGLLRKRAEGLESGGGETLEPTPYRDIWSLRASLEQYASSDLSSNDRDSTRSDADSLSSLGGATKAGGAVGVGAGAGAGAGAAAMMFQSQDIDEELPYDEPLVTEIREEQEEEEDDEEEEQRRERRRRGGGDSVDSERGGSDGEMGSRKLLQMDSGYASMDAPCRAPEELRLFGGGAGSGGGGGGGGGGKTASERRRYFTSAGRKGTVCEESFEARLLQEEPDETELETENHAEPETEKLSVAPVVIPKEPRPSPTKSPLAQKPRLFRRRDYSIDERTEALFNEFLRHDPRLDPRPHPRSRSRLHLRAQWQRTKQHSDPGGSVSAATARLSPSLERLRWGPLRRGESAGHPLDASAPTAARHHLNHHHHHHHLHGPLPRIASAADEENSEGGEEGTEEPQAAGGSVEAKEDNCSNNNSSSSNSSSVQTTSTHSQLGEEIGGLPVILTPGPEDCGILEDPESLVADKIAANLEERLYGGLRRTHGAQEQTVVVSHTTPDDTAE